MPWLKIISRALKLAHSAFSLADAAAGDRLARRQRLAAYSEAVADTLQRAAEAIESLDALPPTTRPVRADGRCQSTDKFHPNRQTAATNGNVIYTTEAAHISARELGRIRGYTEDLLHALGPHLDAGKMRSVKRRLDALCELDERMVTDGPSASDVARLLEAEGYFRSLADRLQVG